MKSKDETSQSREARVFSEAVERMLPGSAYIEQSTAVAGCLTLQDVQCTTGERPRQFQSLPLREAAAAAVGIRVTSWREPARFDVPSWARKYADDIKDPGAKKLVHEFIDLVGACEFRWKVKAEDRVTFQAVLDVMAEFKLSPCGLTSEVTKKGSKKKLNDAQEQEIAKRHAAGEKKVDLAAEFDVSRPLIDHAVERFGSANKVQPHRPFPSLKRR